MQKHLAKILALTELLVEEIELVTNDPKDETKEIVEESKKYMELIEPLIDRFYAQSSISKSTLHSTISQKLNYITDKEFKKYK